MKQKNKAIEGLRGFAILIIVLSHTGILLQGGLGNAIFFGISGFFAAAPFKIDDVEKKYLSPPEILRFYGARLLRILPVYWASLSVVYFIAGCWFDDIWAFLKCCFFIDSYRHLWFLQNTMVFYLLTPIVMILLYILRRIVSRAFKGGVFQELAACSVFLLILAVLWAKFGTVDRVFVLKQGHRCQIHFNQYLLGMCTGYIYKCWNIAQKEHQEFLNGKRNGLLGKMFAGFPIFLLLFTVLSSIRVIRLFRKGSSFLIGHDCPMLCTALGCLCVLSLLICRGTIAERIYNSLPLRYIGKVSFSLYILHLYFVEQINYADKYRTFIGVFVLSMAAAAVSYCVIEKPSAVLSSTHSLKSVRSCYQRLRSFLEEY